MTRTASRYRPSFAKRFPAASSSRAVWTGVSTAIPQADWERLVEGRLAGLDPLSKEARLMQRYFFAGASEARARQAGPRAWCRPTLGKHGGLGREVVVAGVGDHLEIWDRAAWRAHVTELEGSAEDVAERLAAQRD